MKSSLIQPIATWKEPRSFVLENRPQPILYGWVQFRIMLYLIGLVMGCWELGKLNPRRSSQAPGFITILALSLFVGCFVTYGIPLISYLAPCFIRLYPSYLAISRGLSFRYFRFGLISGYRFERVSDHWILTLLDPDGKEALIFIPNEQLKTKTESALTGAGIPPDVLFPVVADQRRKVDEQFQARLKEYRKDATRYDKSTGRWLIVILFFTAILVFLLEHYFPENTAIAFVELMLPWAVIIGYCVMIFRYKKRLAVKSDLRCPHCMKVAINQVYMETLARTHTCPYCGKLFYQFGD